MSVVPLRPANAPLACRGVSLDADSPRMTGVLVTFSRKLTTAELRFFHEVCQRSAPLMDGQDD